MYEYVSSKQLAKHLFLYIFQVMLFLFGIIYLSLQEQITETEEWARKKGKREDGWPYCST